MNRMRKSIPLFALCLLMLIGGSAAWAEDFPGVRGDISIEFLASDLFSEKQAAEWGKYMPLDETISWEVYVPESYDPSKPSGLFVYISPTRSGLIKAEWKQVLNDRNIIWIAANKSGNPQNPRKRGAFAILGTELIRTRYEVDEQRIYLSGFSGGGRMASGLIQNFSHLFKGALYICGVNFWEKTPRSLALMQQNRFVFLTGSRDFNYRDTRDVYREYGKAHIPNIHFMSVKNMAHTLPSAKYLNEALMFLDKES